MIELDEFVILMTRKWGCGRLPLLVDPQLRDRFHCQADLFGKAYVWGDPEAIKIQSIGLLKAWKAMDAAAEAAGVEPLPSADEDEDPIDWENGGESFEDVLRHDC